jgi:hypothetical protein
VNGSGLHVSMFWNTRLYLVERAISFIVFAWIHCLCNLFYMIIVLWACLFPNFKAKWETWSGHAIEINENQQLLHPLVCPWLLWCSFPQEHIYADEVDVEALHFVLLGIICKISWKMKYS